jgi:protein-S-isoprenylcysteine O-methyltransferase Ste14
MSLVIFYGLFAGRTILLYKKGVKVWVVGTSAKKPHEIILENILFPVLLLWSLFIVLSALRVRMPEVISKTLINLGWTKYVGITFCYIGLIIFLLALISFGKAWRIGIDEKNSNELITSGIFRYSRNPIFLFIDLYFTGIMLIYPNVVFITVAISTVVGVHLQILREEKFLLNKFGDEYRRFKKRTRRYI